MAVALQLDSPMRCGSEMGTSIAIIQRCLRSEYSAHPHTTRIQRDKGSSFSGEIGGVRLGSCGVAARTQLIGGMQCLLWMRQFCNPNVVRWGSGIGIGLSVCLSLVNRLAVKWFVECIWIRGQKICDSLFRSKRETDDEESVELVSSVLSGHHHWVLIA